MKIERLSLELTQQCSKGCDFCYNGSGPQGGEGWQTGEVLQFVGALADQGLRAVSLGGGEPLQHPGLFEVLDGLRGRLFRSVTTNGLLLDGLFEALVAARPDKVHVSVHYPDRPAELSRVIRQVLALEAAGLRSGVNLLIGASSVEAAQRAHQQLLAAGIGPERLMLLPRRGVDSPSPAQLAQVAGGARFQSVTCLLRCQESPRFVSVDWSKRVAWCSYTARRRRLPSLDSAGLMAALDGLGLSFCGGALPTPPPGLDEGAHPP
jgi:hypothetical protein